MVVSESNAYVCIYAVDGINYFEATLLGKENASASHFERFRCEEVAQSVEEIMAQMYFDIREERTSSNFLVGSHLRE